MKIRLWGSTGSLPTAMSTPQIRVQFREALLGAKGLDCSDPATVAKYVKSLPLSISGTYKGNTTCVECQIDSSHRIVLDAGSGFRFLGRQMVAESIDPGSEEIHLLFTHLHWDHLMGFPYFQPLYYDGFRINIYGNSPKIIDALKKQQSPPTCPIAFDQIKADLEFHLLEPGRSYEIAGALVETMPQNHPGGSFGYRVESGGRAVVLATDAEFPRNSIDLIAPVLQFFSQADLLLFDSQYDFFESLDTKKDWGHSSAFVGVDLANEAEVRSLILFHHEPANDEVKLEKMLEAARAYAAQKSTPFPKRILLAHDGLEVEFNPGNTSIFYR